MKLRIHLILVGVTMLFPSVARSEEPLPRDCAYEGLASEQCVRVAQITSRWPSGALGSIALAGVPDPGYPEDTRPNPELEIQSVRIAAREREIGPCRYHEGEERIEVQRSAFSYSDESLAACLAAAYAQARYHSVEGEWLAMLGEHEAWVVRKGVLVKVSVDRKLEAPAARFLWASLATRELLRAWPSPEALGTGRSLASNAGDAAALDPEVRALLGFENDR